ncbi:hypothetical protein BGLT_02326 [Caballeronia glathei]|nr:hypothetical protein BGLT_02326 [Caballeronia glathei]
MREQRIDGGLVAVHHVEHALGQPGLSEQFREPDRRRRIALRRLQHERVAGGDRDREHPARHHHREIERRDARDDAERLAQIPVVDAPADLVGEIGLEQIRNAAGKFDDLDAAHHFALGVAEHLAVLAGDELGQLVVVLVEQLLELEHHAGALERRGFAPGGECGFRGGDGRIDFRDARERHARRNRAGGRVEHVAETVARAVHPPSADEMRQRRNARFALM